MADTAERALRAAIARGLDALNRDHGGRFLGRVASAIGVHRSTVSRWAAGTATPSFDHTTALSRRYPDHFDAEQLKALHLAAAVGAGSAALPPATTASITMRFREVYQAATDAILDDSRHAVDREILHVGLHLELEPVEPIDEDSSVDPADRAVIEAFRAAMIRRANEGWRIRSVVNGGAPARFRVSSNMTHALDGPDVEMRAYPGSVPLVISPLIIGRRDVVLAYDGIRTRRPAAAIVVSDSSVAAWVTRYFNDLFGEAPLRLRTQRGVDHAGLRAFAEACGAEPSG